MSNGVALCEDNQREKRHMRNNNTMARTVDRLSSKTGHVDATIAVQRNMSLHLAVAWNSMVIEPKFAEPRVN
jgi:hypothetical protein